MEHTALSRQNKECRLAAGTPPDLLPEWKKWKREVTATANLIRMIHRKDDAYVGFYTPDNDKKSGWRCMKGIRAENMKEQFPGIAPDAINQEDVYFTVNSYWPGQRNEGKESIGYLGRAERFLRSLNACYVDLDVNRLPLFEKPNQPEAWQGWRQAMATVGEMADQGEIPQPSIFAKSGRGLYVYWLLRDVENPDQPPAAFHLDLYKRINRAIQERLQSVAPDPAAKDGARVLRVPNSKHRNGVAVKYLTQHDENGDVPVYTLGDLAECFDVGQGKSKGRRYKQGKSIPKRRNGWLEVNRKRARDLERVAAAECIRHGCRRKALGIYAWALRGSGMHPRETTEKVRRLAKQCIPPYPSEDNDTPVEMIVSDIYGKTPAESAKALELKHQYVCNTIGITAEMAEELKLETIVPDSVKREREERRRNAPTKAQERRKWLVEYLMDAMRENPSLRDLAERAMDAGHKCTHETIRRDLETLRGKSGRN